VIVLILVAILWIAVLVPSVISKLSERRSAGSIDHFHRRLDLLQRTGPKLVQPAYRLTGTESVPMSDQPVVRVTSEVGVRPNLMLVPLADTGPGTSADIVLEPGAPQGEPETLMRLHSLMGGLEQAEVSGLSEIDQRRLAALERRRIARRRRRDVFGTLCGLAALTGLIGLAHPLRDAWFASAAFVALLVAFIALAVYGQRVEAERRHLTQLRRADQARSAGEDVESGAVKYLSEEELAHYYEVEDARLAAGA
jgi:hypothetical protein